MRKGRITLNALHNCFIGVSCQSHIRYLVFLLAFDLAACAFFRALYSENNSFARLISCC